MREDQERDEHRHEEVASGAYDETQRLTEQDVLLPSQEVPVEGPVKRSKDDFDMFAEDDDDMFADDPAPNGNAAAGFARGDSPPSAAEPACRFPNRATRARAADRSPG